MLSLIISALFIALLPLSKRKFAWHNSSMALLGLSIYALLRFLPLEFSDPSSSLKLLLLDILSTPLIILTLWISGLILYARYSIFNKRPVKLFFLFLIIVLNLILVVTFSVSNLLLFYICFEASLIPTILVILGWGYQPERLQASFYIILYTVAASLPLLIAILYIYTTNLSTSFLLSQTVPVISDLISFPFALIIRLAFFVKMPLYTTHLWLPKAHVEAPVAGSIILAGILLKLGGYGLLRISTLYYYTCPAISTIFISLAMWGAVITSMICIRQTDLKSLIAYSSVGHMGLLAAGLLTNTSWGWEGALTIILAHGLCSSGLFAIANITYEATNTRRLFLTKGLLIYFPAIRFWWFLLAAGNIAAPTSLNLLREIILLTSVLSKATVILIPIGIIGFLAAAYSLFLYTTTQHGPFPKFSNPTSLYTTHNYFTILIHSVPLYILVLKTDSISNWL